MKTERFKTTGLFLLVFAIAMFATGCMSWLYEQETDPETGAGYFVDEEKTEAARAAGLIEPDEVIPTTEATDAKGKAREPIYSDKLKPGVLAAIKAGTGLGDMFFPGLGALLGAVVTGGLAAARGVKQKRRYNAKVAAESGGRLLMSKAALIFAQIVADFSAGKIDTDDDGKIALSEVKVYALGLAKEHLLDVDLATRLVEIATSGWDLSSKLRALEGLAAEAPKAAAQA